MAWGDQGAGDNDFGPLQDGDPLARLGLVDPKTGQALATADWTPPADYPQRFRVQTDSSDTTGGDDTDSDDDDGGADADADADRTGDTTRTDQQPAQRPQAGQQGGKPPAGPDWESDQNPYKTRFAQLQSRLGPADPARDAAQQFDQRVNQLRGEAAQFVQQLTTVGIDGQKWPQQVAQTVADALLAGAIAQAERDRDRAVLMPTARRAVAEQIASEFSTGNVKIEANELADYNTPDAMRTAAKVLQDTRRDKSFNGRRKTGKDRAETGAPAGKVTQEQIDALSPFSKITLGLRRGDL